MSRLCIVAVLGALVVPVARGQEPLGSQFMVNSEPSFNPTDPRVAAGSDDVFLVVWTSAGSTSSDDDLWSVQGRLFAADQSPVGAQFQINNYTTSGQTHPDIARGADDRFFVVWESDGSFGADNTLNSIQGRILESDGQFTGNEFQINTTPFGNQRSAVVAASSTEHVVVWWDEGDVRGQRYDLNASPIDAEFQVNTAPYRNSVSGPDVDAAPDGSFVVVWVSDSPGAVDDYWVRARQFDAMGDPLADEFSVSLDLDRLVLWPRVLVEPDGEFSVFWLEDTNMLWRRFDAAGAPLTGEMLLSDTRPGVWDPNAVSLGPGGDVVALWRSDPSRGSHLFATLRGKGVVAPTSALSPFELSGDKDVAERYPGVDHFDDGSFLVVWTRIPLDPHGAVGSLQAQTFAAPSPLFVDGFESGDSSAWSEATPGSAP